MRNYSFSLSALFFTFTFVSMNSFTKADSSITIDRIKKQVINAEIKSLEFPVVLRIKELKFEAGNQFAEIYDERPVNLIGSFDLMHCFAHRKDAHAKATYRDVDKHEGLTAQINFSNPLDGVNIEIHGSRIIDSIVCSEFYFISDLSKIFRIKDTSALKIDEVDELFSDSNSAKNKSNEIEI